MTRVKAKMEATATMIIAALVMVGAVTLIPSETDSSLFLPPS